jgi:hypothetical protein
VAEVWTPPAFDDVSTGELVTASQINALGNSLRFLKRIAYVEFTSDVNVSATTVGTANTIVSSGAITYENVPHLIEFWCAGVTSVGAITNIILKDSSTVLGTFNVIPSGGNGASPLYCARVLMPSAASHTYSVAGWVESADTVVFEAGTGGTAGNSTTYLPGYIAVYRVPT